MRTLTVRVQEDGGILGCLWLMVLVSSRYRGESRLLLLGTDGRVFRH